MGFMGPNRSEDAYLCLFRAWGLVGSLHILSGVLSCIIHSLLGAYRVRGLGFPSLWGPVAVPSRQCQCRYMCMHVGTDVWMDGSVFVSVYVVCVCVHVFAFLCARERVCICQRMRALLGNPEFCTLHIPKGPDILLLWN